MSQAVATVSSSSLVRSLPDGDSDGDGEDYDCDCDGDCDGDGDGVNRDGDGDNEDLCKTIHLRGVCRR